MEQLPHVASGRGGVLRATAMPEIAVPFSLRCATAGAVHPADAKAIYRWRSAGQALLTPTRTWAVRVRRSIQRSFARATLDS